MIPVEKRLLDKAVVNLATGCWEWIATRDGAGYGMFRINGRTERAHRVSYQLLFGPIPRGMCVCHVCDNPSCIYPLHLFLGTQAENVADRDAKGRHPRTRGEKHGGAKLTEADVVAIRAAKGGWGLLSALARQYGVSRTQISYVRSGKNWSHVASAEAQLAAAKSILAND